MMNEAVCGLDKLFAEYSGDYQPVEADTGMDVGLEIIEEHERPKSI